MATSLAEASSGEDEELVVNVPEKDAEGRKCGGHSDDRSHLEAVTSRKPQRGSTDNPCRVATARDGSVAMVFYVSQMLGDGRRRVYVERQSSVA